MPMIKTILVAATGSERDAATFAAALAAGRPFAAHLDVLHVRADPVAMAVSLTADVGTGALTAGLIERLEQDAREREAAAYDGFSRFCGGAGLQLSSVPAPGQSAAPSAEWHVETGEEPRWIATRGMTADLIVAGRAGKEEQGERPVLEAALLDTGRPLLIPAAAPMPAGFERIAIAWKPTREAARAVALAMPFLARAKQVAVITVEEEVAGRPAPADAADWLVRNLAWHGLAAHAERLTPGPEGGAARLLAEARARADLLVMGGYGHSRLREWVFGGFTQHVLEDAPLPVLLAH
jgi:nucleotide-binding universal stress UspA family protein